MKEEKRVEEEMRVEGQKSEERYKRAGGEKIREEDIKVEVQDRGNIIWIKERGEERETRQKSKKRVRIKERINNSSIIIDSPKKKRENRGNEERDQRESDKRRS